MKIVDKIDEYLERNLEEQTLRQGEEYILQHKEGWYLGNEDMRIPEKEKDHSFANVFTYKDLSKMNWKGQFKAMPVSFKTHPYLYKD